MNASGFAVSEMPCLSVPKIYGAKSLALVKKMNLLNQKFGVQREKGYLYLPLTRESTATEINELKRDLPEFEICTRLFFERVEHQPKLVDLLSDRLPPHILASLPHSIDFVGDIATVELAPELESYKQAIGEAILKI